jgi:hypothetical protein
VLTRGQTDLLPCLEKDYISSCPGISVASMLVFSGLAI